MLEIILGHVFQVLNNSLYLSGWEKRLQHCRLVQTPQLVPNQFIQPLCAERAIYSCTLQASRTVRRLRTGFTHRKSHILHFGSVVTPVTHGGFNTTVPGKPERRFLNEPLNWWRGNWAQGSPSLEPVGQFGSSLLQPNTMEPGSDALTIWHGLEVGFPHPVSLVFGQIGFF